MMHVPEWVDKIEDEYNKHLSPEEMASVMAKTNHATAILSEQSAHLRRLKEKGFIWEFSFLEMEGMIKTLFDLQGKSERIKNFPYPRQYASISHYYVRIFVLFLPFGVIPQFAEFGNSIIEVHAFAGLYFVWLSIPITMLVAWVFNTMLRIGQAGENPFEGTANDVPISTISRGIEIDLLEMINEAKADIPEKLHAHHNIQM
jgi:putative membrane protein